nr:hypothetical protein [Lachnospiraceae bacterium]
GYNQSQPRSMNDFNVAPQPYNQKKKSAAPVIIIVVVVLAALATLFIFVIKPKFIDKKDKTEKTEVTSSQSDTSSENSSGSDSSENEGESKDTEDKDTSDSSEDSEDGDSSENTETTEDEESSDVLTDKEAKKTAQIMSTKKRPNVGDFEWFYRMYYKKGNQKRINKFFNQKGAVKFENQYLAEGGWKVCMIGNTHKYHVKGDRMFNMYIKSYDNGKYAKVKFDWWIMHDEKGKTYKEKYKSTEICKWNKKRNKLSGDFLTLNKFMTYKGKQYAFGSYKWPSGENDYVVLIRP